MPKSKPTMTPSPLARKRALVLLQALKWVLPDAKISLKYHSNWELLVAVILSAQCTDKKVNEVTAKLFKKYRSLDDYVRVAASGGTPPKAVASASRRTVAEFERDIRSTGFYRAKAKNILAAAKLVKEKFGGKLPRTMAEMLTIPGVARKTANVVLGNAYGVVEGIAVDTHVRRLAKRYGLTTYDDPVKIERDLMALYPKKEWFTLTYRLIDYGRKYCPARPHDHTECPVSIALKKKGLLPQAIA